MNNTPSNNRITKQSGEFSWLLSDLIESTQGVLMTGAGLDLGQDCPQFNSVSTDSRTLEPGALYIALVGEHFDGHDFIHSAVAQGAAAVLVSTWHANLHIGVPAVLVDDTRLALGQFARWHRLQMPLKKCIAITGSNGKTTTKTWLDTIFSQVGATLATEGNLNNDYGVPRTLLNLRPEHEFAIIEMGANHRGEIGYLTQLALPDIALITNASAAHLEGFGSVQNVIETKGQIFLGLNQRHAPHHLQASLESKHPHEEGVAVINTDSMGYAEWRNLLKTQHISQCYKFGTDEQADVQVLDSAVNASGITVTLQFNHLLSTEFTHALPPNIQLDLPVLGAHNALNAAACVAVALSAGLTWAQIQPGLVSFTGVKGRLQKTRLTAIKHLDVDVIDDSYNANPASVKAGIDALVSLPGLAILCLGAMGELGEQVHAAHQDVSQYAKQQGVDYLFVLGAAAKEMPMAFGKQSQWFESHENMIAAVNTILKGVSASSAAANDLRHVTILVKGSRLAKMEKIVQGLMAIA
ncbi:UDP-N-acetylmuramoyl-tripeptide--D-alanyl-D-alanine ligase [Thiomicrorhabdus aquaedulcis]|uniref:UDP-N-acetylmuramoyl-tripeptide--D-alanyl-D- alanine ligase n=1 Tax=Thiomicrorhabdus aquaedulcis TaxID=2211106 RepID=UPI001E48B1E8|nr:UDP-N-acetylmuramoyl-tripeptide--D-alanyl-D-alanine ligase [Thiomicrorhabdus aquaedulcis]